MSNEKENSEILIYVDEEENSFNQPLLEYDAWLDLYEKGYTGCAGGIHANKISDDKTRERFFKSMPTYVGEELCVKDNGLTSLDNFPSEIGERLACYNKELMFLGASYPIHVHGDLNLFVDDSARKEDSSLVHNIVHMKNINRIGELIVDGAILGFSTEDFIKNKPNRESLENGIKMLSLAANSNLFKEGIAMMQEAILNLDIRIDAPPPRPSSGRF